MIIIGADYHPSDQYIAFVDTETGECGERQLNHSDREAEKFYRQLKQRGVCMRVGMEATGYSRWFERLLAELGIEVWIGDAAEIKTKRVRKQKTDREDARLLLRLMRENNFPRIWVPSPEIRDVRQLRIADHTTPRRPKYFRFGLRNFLSREYELLMMKAVPFRCI
jgi:transposase